MRIATMATGGIGGYLAVRLTQGGHEVATIARGQHLEAIQANGLALEGPHGREVVQPWMATDDPAACGPVDAIIFAVKGDALPAAAKACVPMIGPETVVVPFLNGVEAADRLVEILPPEHVANGVAKVSTTITKPGVIGQTGEFNTFIFAERDSRLSARIAALQAAINASGSDAPVTDNVERELWSKFVIFTALSGVTAAARCTVGDIVAHPELAALCRGVIAETAAVGRAQGVALPDDIEERLWSFLKTLPAEGRASTAADIAHGRPLEIDWVSGAACRLAAETGVPAPLNNALYAVLLPHREGRAPIETSED